LKPILKVFGVYEAQDPASFGVKALRILCIYSQGTCNQIMTYFANEHFEEEDLERERVYFGHFPAGSSLRTWEHMNQIVDT